MSIADISIDFGFHKGKLLGQVPSDYLEWIAKNFDSRKWLEKAIAELLRRKNIRLNADPKLAGWVTEITSSSGQTWRLKCPCSVAIIQELIDGSAFEMGAPMPTTTQAFEEQPLEQLDLAELSDSAKEQTATVLRELGRSDSAIRVPSNLIPELARLLPIEMEVADDDPAISAILLALEAMRHGQLVQAKMLTENATMQVATLEHMRTKWTIKLVEGAIPRLFSVSRSS